MVREGKIKKWQVWPMDILFIRGSLWGKDSLGAQ